jgi:hypothetical protein
VHEALLHLNRHTDNFDRIAAECRQDNFEYLFTNSNDSPADILSHLIDDITKLAEPLKE